MTPATTTTSATAMTPATARVFWDSFLRPGDLVFDVGANIGNKTSDFLVHVAKVVAIEPQSSCVARLQQRFGSNSRVIIVNKGLSDHCGSEELLICSSANTISTFFAPWKTGRFAGYEWDQKAAIDVTTLDELIASYGVPQYVKIDVEGYEQSVLAGLSRTIPLLSFEFAVEFVDNARRCLDHLELLGYRRFNLAIGEADKFYFEGWISAREIDEFIRSSAGNDLWKEMWGMWGDIYAIAEHK